ncbi:MAG: hypothetical protein D6812_13035 [Deltaproteobacteria bacterium]|nr:MAG: hypothetical protein D6812_13035 [Deltaproteobacteria bacterium]
MAKSPFTLGKIVRLQEGRGTSLGCEGRCGIVMTARSRCVEVFFPEIFRGFWLPTDGLQRISPLDPSVPRPIRRIVALLRMSGAKGWELDRLEGDRVELRLRVERCDISRLDELRAYLSDDLHDLVIEPGGRAWMTLAIIFDNPR